MSEKLSVKGFKWIENTSQFNEDLIKSYNEESDEEYFFEVDVQCPEKLHSILAEIMKIEKAEEYRIQPVCMLFK